MTVDNPDFVGSSALHVGKYNAFSVSGQVIGPSITYSTGNFAVTKPGYVVYIIAQMAAAALNPFVLADVTWEDGVTGDVLAAEKWVIPAGTATTIRTNGRGQTKGDQVRVKLTNLDLLKNVTVSFSLFETTHSAARDDWRSDMNGNWSSTNPNVFPAQGSPLSGTLFQAAPNIGAGVTNAYQFGLYAGQIEFFETDAGATGLSISISPTQDLDTSVTTTKIYSFTGAAAGVKGTLVLPRQPCIVSITNPNGVAVLCNLNIRVLEYAS